MIRDLVHSTQCRGRVRFAGGWVLLLLVAGGCNRSGSENRAEVRSVSAAIDRLRQAPNPEKEPKLVELSHVPCSLKDVCELRDRCVGAYKLHVEALQQIAAAKNGAAKDGGVVLTGDEVAAIDQKLEGAHKLVKECLEHELVVGRRHGTQL